MFSNVTDPNIISVNLNATISDHLSQFGINLDVFGNISDSNKRICLKFDRRNFMLDYFSVDWVDMLKLLN